MFTSHNFVILPTNSFFQLWKFIKNEFNVNNMKAISIKTPMNVSVQAKFASPGSRVLSFLIDLFIIFIYFRAIVFLYDLVLNYHFYNLGSDAYALNMFYSTLFTI